MASPDVDLIEMADPAIARGDSDVFELYVHVVLRFDQFAPVHLARCDLKRYDMVLSFIQQLYGDPDGASHLED